MYDAVIAGGGLAGLDAGAAAAARIAGAARAGRREDAASGARGGTQGRRVERRDRRALLPERSSASSRTCAPGSSRSSACAISSLTAAITTSRRRFELGPPQFPVGAVVSARSRPARERAVRRAVGRRRRGAGRLQGPARRIERGRAPAPRSSTSTAPAASRTVEARLVVDASGRAGLIRRQLGLTKAGHARRQRLLVPRQARRIEVDDWIDRSGMARRACRPASAG